MALMHASRKHDPFQVYVHRTSRNCRTQCWDYVRHYRRLVNQYSRSISAGLNLSGDDQPRPEKLVEESRDLVRDYIYTRLTNAGLTHRKFRPASVGDHDKEYTEVSQQILAIGEALEHRYPELYRNISRQLNMTMSSEEMVRRTYTSVAELICKGELHWGKVIALFAMAGGFAIDCVQQGHPEYANKIVDCFGVFVSKNLSEWLVEQGGWVSN